MHPQPIFLHFEEYFGHYILIFILCIALDPKILLS